MPETIVIAHNIRSIHNIGSIFRTCEGFGVKKLIISGYSPYPKIEKDTRLPHISEKLTAQIHKTALGAENMIPFEYQAVPDIQTLKQKGFKIIGLEQNAKSINISEYKKTTSMAILLGEEVNGIESNLIEMCDDIVEIPMHGKKESFNVSVAAGIALYALSI